MRGSEPKARGRLRSFASGLLIGLLFAVNMTLAFPAVPAVPAWDVLAITWLWGDGLAVAGYFALIFLVFGSLGLKGRLGWAFAGVYVGCIPFPLSQHIWVFAISDLGAPFLVFYLALFPTVFAVLCRWWLLRLGGVGYSKLREGDVIRWRFLLLGPVGIATLWVGLEVLRGYVLFDGYPWHFVGQPGIEKGRSTWGPVVGLTGVSWLFVFVVFTLVLWLPQQRKIAMLGVLILLWAYGATLGVRYFIPTGETHQPQRIVRIGVLQTNLPQSVRGSWAVDRRFADFDAFVMATNEMVREFEPDLIVWPETMFPGPSLERSYRDVLEGYLTARGSDPDVMLATGLASALERAQGVWDVPMLVGSVAVVDPVLTVDPATGNDVFEPTALYNSMFVIDGGVVGERYDKMHLTPFGEVMPYISAWPWLERQLLSFAARGMSFDLDEGENATPLTVDWKWGELSVATPICFEATNPGVVRRLVVGDDGERRAQLIVHPTNDGWFGDFDHGRRLHEQLLRWRCIEFGTPGVRVANTGISGAYDARGRAIEPVYDGRASAAREFGIVVFDVPVANGPMPPAAWLERWVRWGTLVGFFGVIVAGLVLGRKGGAGEAEAS